ncbi:hypothetical protein MVEN_01083300 [Mycena venus]|uniref:F-box domain-containing protein n=1 Tax=Mycena venus TaxID=2733690 RepID=A0A8H7D097_9AGAR|nr:hypothetical protein MVEN_01083300 [Mycena venus]
MSSCISHEPLESILLALRSNVVPEPPERLAIRISIVEAEQSLFSVDEEFSQKASNFIAMSSSRLAPVRCLPPEILSSIFLHSILDSPLAIGRPQDFSVAAVSFHWREVALSTPSLWSRFSISLRGGEAAFQMLQLCLKRAKVSLLTIEIRKDAALQRPVHGGMVDHLIQKSDQWMRISVPLDYQLLVLFSSVRGRLSSLEIASFALATASEDSDVSLGDIDAFEIAPKLRSLSLRNTADALPLFPLNQLERVLFTNISKDRIVLIIDQSPNLRSLTCRWSADSPYPHPDDPHPPVTLEFLDTIDLKGDYYLLRFLTTPRLKFLSLTNMQHLSKPIFRRLFARSQCTLHTLFLDKVWAHWTCVVEILQRTPTLHSLTILDGRPNSVTDKAIEALVIDPAIEAQVLPGLRKLTLHGSYLFRTSKLLDMLESRMMINVDVASHVTRLRLVDLRLDQRQFTEGELERFRALQGPDVEVSLRRFDAQKSACTKQV